MEYRDFHLRESILTPAKEIELRAAMLAVQNQNTLLLDENTSLKEENALLRERLAWFEKQVYGQKSEKTEIVMETAEQLPMFDEVEEEADITPQEVKTTEVKSHKRKTKRTHDEIFAELPVEEVVHMVEDTTCDRCGADMVIIGKEKVRDELVYIPARMFLRRHIAEVAKCTVCGMDESRDADLPDTEKCHMRQAPVPEPLYSRFPHLAKSNNLLYDTPPRLRRM